MHTFHGESEPVVRLSDIRRKQSPPARRARLRTKGVFLDDLLTCVRENELVRLQRD
jgi:hypothetical protein